MWGLGCILIELHTGEPVFAGENELDQLSKITEVLGLPPDEMVLRSPRAKLFFSFTKKGQLWTYKLKHKPVQHAISLPPPDRCVFHTVLMRFC